MTVFAQSVQLPSVSIDPLVKLVQIGEFGSAVAMLLLGFYLSWQASSAPMAEIPARKAVARQFMLVALAFFIVCVVVEITKLIIPEHHPKISAMITVPPLNESNYDEYGKIDIVGMDSTDQKPVIRHGSVLPQYFSIHDNSSFVIDLNGLVKKLSQDRQTSQVATKDLFPPADRVGAPGPK